MLHSDGALPQYSLRHDPKFGRETPLYVITRMVARGLREGNLGCGKGTSDVRGTSRAADRIIGDHIKTTIATNRIGHGQTQTTRLEEENSCPRLSAFVRVQFFLRPRQARGSLLLRASAPAAEQDQAADDDQDDGPGVGHQAPEGLAEHTEGSGQHQEAGDACAQGGPQCADG